MPASVALENVGDDQNTQKLVADEIESKSEADKAIKELRSANDYESLSDETQKFLNGIANDNSSLKELLDKFQNPNSDPQVSLTAKGGVIQGLRKEMEKFIDEINIEINDKISNWLISRGRIFSAMCVNGIIGQGYFADRHKQESLLRGASDLEQKLKETEATLKDRTGNISIPVNPKATFCARVLDDAELKKAIVAKPDDFIAFLKNCMQAAAGK